MNRQLMDVNRKAANHTYAIKLYKAIGVNVKEVVCDNALVDSSSDHSLIHRRTAAATTATLEDVPYGTSCPRGCTKRVQLRWRRSSSAASRTEVFYVVDALPRGQEVVLGKNAQAHSQDRPYASAQPVHFKHLDSSKLNETFIALT